MVDSGHDRYVAAAVEHCLQSSQCLLLLLVHTVTENNYSTLNLKLAAAEHCQFIGALILSWRGRHTDGGSFTLYVKFFGWMKSEWLLSIRANWNHRFAKISQSRRMLLKDGVFYIT